MNLQELQTAFNKSSTLVSVLIRDCKFFGEEIAFSDPKYLPFYFHLKEIFKPKNVLNVNFSKFGLKEICLYSDVIESYAGICQKYDLEIKWGIQNIKKITGKEIKLSDSLNFNEKFDVILCDDPSYAKKEIENLWNLLNYNGVLVVENTYKNEDFELLSFIVNREAVIFESRYNVGAIQR